MKRNTFNENWQGPERTIEVVERERADDRIAIVDQHGKPVRVIRDQLPRVGFDHAPKVK